MIDASELDDRAGFTRQAIAIRQDHVGGILRVDDNMPGLGDHFAQGGTAQYILGMNGNAQSSDRREFACRIAHAAGRSAMVVCTVITVPLLISRRSALRPMLSGPK